MKVMTISVAIPCSPTLAGSAGGSLLLLHNRHDVVNGKTFYILYRRSIPTTISCAFHPESSFCKTYGIGSISSAAGARMNSIRRGPFQGQRLLLFIWWMQYS
jgi:hypothetical protein